MSKKKTGKKKKLYNSNNSRRHSLENSVKDMMPDAKFIWKDDDNKLSDAIVHYAGPMLEKCSGFKEQEKMLIFAIVVWNMCLLPQKEANMYIDKIHEEMGNGDSQAIKDMDEVMNYLIDRKKRLYEDDKRIVVSYNITKTKDKLHLNVAYPT